MTLEQENKILKEHLAALYLNISYMLTAHTEEPEVDPDGWRDNGYMKYSKYELIDYLGRNGRFDSRNLLRVFDTFVKPEIEK